MVEVAEHDEDASALGTERILDRDFNVFELPTTVNKIFHTGVVSADAHCNVRSSGCRRVRCLDRLSLDTLAAFNKYDGEAVLCLATYCEAEHARQLLHVYYPREFTH